MFNFKNECKPGEKIQAISEARRDQVDSGAFKKSYTESVGPCALCRDALSSLNKDAKVIQPIGGEVKTVPVSFIYPSRKFLAGEESMSDLEKEYRELLLAISKDFPITADDQMMIKKGERRLEDKVNSGPDEEVMLVAARGFSGETYTNTTPKLIRNPQSLVIDKPVEFQLVCESAENQDQVLTLIVFKGKREGSQQHTKKVMLPAGVSRELIRQFHPLATVIVDFGKDGLGKLPIEVLYPLVYKLRKRKNGNHF
jgi:cytidine deaminase